MHLHRIDAPVCARRLPATTPPVAPASHASDLRACAFARPAGWTRASRSGKRAAYAVARFPTRYSFTDRYYLSRPVGKRNHIFEYRQRIKAFGDHQIAV